MPSPTPTPTPTPFPTATPTPSPIPTETPTATNPSNLEGQRAALAAFYNATDGDNWTNNDGWLSDLPLDQWHGIATDGQGNVVDLLLAENNLTGTLPAAIADLPRLGLVELAVNNLSGPIPAELGQHESLWSLDLAFNQLTGDIPPELGMLTQLTALDLQGNGLTGTVPPELGDLSLLRFLGLASNELAGTIPIELGKLTNLTSLALEDNRLTGTVPTELGNLQQLNFLGLARNELTGTIPIELGELTELEWVFISGNGFEDCIPDTLQLIENNDFEQLTIRHCTSTPAEDRAVLVALYNATGGDNWTNNEGWLSDLPLNQWYGVTTNERGNVTDLALRENMLTGTMPPEIGNLKFLESLALIDNDLTGCLPGSLRDIEDTDFLFSSLHYCDEPPKTHPPVTPAFIKWDIGDDVRKSEERAARLGVQWLFEYAETIGWPIVGEDVHTYLNTMEPLAYAYADLDGTIHEGEIESLLAWLPSIGGFQHGDSVFNRATEVGDPIDRWQLYRIASVLIHEHIHAAFQLDASALYMSSKPHGLVPPRWFTEGMATYFDGLIPSLHGGETDFLCRGDCLKFDGVPVSQIPLSTTEEGYCQHTCGAFAVELLVSLVGPRRIIDLHTLGRPGRTWQQTFEEVFDISVPDFYALYDQHREAGFPKLSLPDSEATQSSGTGSTQLPDDPGDRAALVAFYNATRGDSWVDNRNWLTDQPLATWLGVSVDSNGRVQGISLWNNGLGGSIPQEIGDLARLKWLYLHDNEIRGTIPERITQLTGLEDLWLGKNQIGGSIPEGIDNMTNLQYLDLNNNNISGRLPASMMSMSWLRYLDLQNVNLVGPIPNNIGGLESVEVINLDENQLSGNLPDSIGSLSNLREFKVSDNRFSGQFPAWLTQLNNLGSLGLSGNSFTGCIPPELFEIGNSDLSQMPLSRCN